jgi:hypothetical protein
MSESGREKFTAYAKAELAGIESSLKEWFITRRFRMERALAIKKELDENNFTGLSMQNIANIPPQEASMWRDLVIGKPSIESTLSVDAKTRKIELYTEMFDKATDADNKCRPSGMTFLRCLDDHRDGSGCDDQFALFDACRADLLKQQRDVIDSKLAQQDVEDKRAKSLFERRHILLDAMNKTAL